MDFSLWLTRAEYLFHETGLGLQRGGWVNWAAISTVTVLLLLFGISVQTVWQVDGLIQQLGSQLQVSAYLQPGVRGETVQPLVAQLPQVAAVEVIPRERAWEELLAELGATDMTGATTGLRENPLVDELQVQVHSPGEVLQLARQLEQIQGVDEVQYLEEALQNLAHLGQGLKQLSLVVVSLLTLAAIAVITTTMRLIVMARTRDIEIMQLVGATRVWIYLPFVLQGVVFGLTGAAIAWGLLVGMAGVIQSLLSQQPNFLQFLADGLRLHPGQRLLLPLILLGFGMLVGLVGSGLAVRQLGSRSS